MTHNETIENPYYSARVSHVEQVQVTPTEIVENLYYCEQCQHTTTQRWSWYWRLWVCTKCGRMK